jgi:hypothetical protein
MLILSVLALPIFFVHYPTKRKLWTFVASGVVLACVLGWYFLWVPHLNETFGYGNHFTTGCPLLSMGWAEIQANWPDILKRLFIVPTKYLGFVIFVGSLIYILYKRQWTPFALFIIPYICFLFVILKTGKNIISDQYYVLGIIPAMAFVSGFALSQISNRQVMWILLAAIAIENIGDQITDFRPHKMNVAFENVETIVDSVSTRQDLFVINSGLYCPTVMYFAHRKGWTVAPSKLLDKQFLDEIKAKGCRFVLVCKRMYNEDYDVKPDLPQIFESKDFRIYSLM